MVICVAECFLNPFSYVLRPRIFFGKWTYHRCFSLIKFLSDERKTLFCLRHWRGYLFFIAHLARVYVSLQFLSNEIFVRRNQISTFVAKVTLESFFYRWSSFDRHRVSVGLERAFTQNISWAASIAPRPSKTKSWTIGLNPCLNYLQTLPKKVRCLWQPLHPFNKPSLTSLC